MTDLWGFLLQTMEASWAALFLLIIKRLLSDKLSPRWQYGIWSLFFLRLLVPAGVTGRYLLTSPVVALQTLRESAESALSSRFCTAAAPVNVSLGLPWMTGKPESITDWLFVIYLAGVVFCIGRYFFSYLCLRFLLRGGQPVPAKLQAQLDAVCSRYHLKPCRAVMLPEAPSAFICGVCSPVLVLPTEEIDDKILLHELLHRRSMDALQSILWSFFRSVHWCNPFLQYVFNRIGNDMESLCDQRILERLEGEERRRYGKILLDMTNDRYPRAPGTTSLSNGGRNIRRRIEAIARFRKYPRGMGLVSMCIGATLFFPLLSGVSRVTLPTGSGTGTGAFSPEIAAAHLVNCTTAAGALDTFAKGVMDLNPVWLTASGGALAQEQTRALMDAIQTDRLVFDGSYYVYNPELQEDGSFRLLLVFPSDSVSAENSRFSVGAASPDTGCYVFPVRLHCSAHRTWTVEVTGDCLSFLTDDAFGFAYGSDSLPAMSAEKKGDTGTFFGSFQLIYTVEQSWDTEAGSPGFLTGITKPESYFTPFPDTDAVFASAFCSRNFQWTPDEAFLASRTASHAELYVTFTNETADAPADLSKTVSGLDPVENYEGSDFFTVGSDFASASWNGELYTGGGSSFGQTGGSVSFPSETLCRMDLSLDGILQETAFFTVKKGVIS